MLGCIVAVAARLITIRDTPSTKSSTLVGSSLKAIVEASVTRVTTSSLLSKFIIELIIEAYYYIVYSSYRLNKLKIIV